MIHKNLLFFFLLLCIFIPEGLGLPYGHELSFILILIIPAVLFFTTTKSGETTLLPKKLSILFSFFLVISFLSVIFSVNIYKSVEYLALYVSCGLFFIYAYNQKEIISKFTPLLIIILALIFSIYSILLSFFKIASITDTGLQFVFAKYGSHNHLGDFLILALITLFYFLLNKKNKLITLLSILLFLPFFIFSYSRSAYLDLGIIACILFVNIFFKKAQSNFKTVSMALLGILILILGFFFFTTTKDFNSTLINRTRNILVQNHQLSNKYFFGERQNYISEALSAIIEKPLFGVGPGNFVYASLKYATPDTITSYTHNIFLNIFAENGIIAGILFLLIIIVVFSSLKLNLITLLSLALLLNFQTDYTYGIFSLLIFFFVLLGISYKENEEINIGRYIFVLPILLMTLALFIITNNFYIKITKQPPSLCTHPITKVVFEPSLFNFPLFMKGDPNFLECQARFYEEKKDKKRALYYYKLTYDASFVNKYSLGTKIYSLKLDTEGKKSAMEFANQYFEKLKNMGDSITQDGSRIEAMKLCQKLYSFQCPYDL